MAVQLKIVLGSDHGGFELKEQLKEILLKTRKNTVSDVGCKSADRCDYPDFAKAVCAEVMKMPDSTLGVVVCGSGIGISIACNKIDGIRCALCHDHYDAKI